MSFGIIYKIVFPNGKHYIGLTTTSLKQRKNLHKSCIKNGNTECLYNALRKYKMLNTFELIQIDTSNTREDLCEKEKKYIIFYNSYYRNKTGYNMTYGGDGGIGYVWPSKQKQKRSDAVKKRCPNPDERKKLSDAVKKRYANLEILDTKGKNKPFDMFKDGVFIKTFIYKFQARDYLEKEYSITSHVRITDFLSGVLTKSCGFVFKYT